MARVVLTDSADADSESIIRYLGRKAGPSTVLKYRTLFKALYHRLADHPDIGAPRPDLGRNIRIGVVTPYIFVYEHPPGAEIVTVLRILHGRRKVVAKLLSE